MASLEVIEGLLEQATDEQIPYSMDFTDYGVATLASATVIVLDEVDGSNVTATVGALTATVSGAVATLTVLKTLTKGHTYKINVLGKEGSNYYRGYFRVGCNE